MTQYVLLESRTNYNRGLFGVWHQRICGEIVEMEEKQTECEMHEMWLLAGNWRICQCQQMIPLFVCHFIPVAFDTMNSQTLWGERLIWCFVCGFVFICFCNFFLCFFLDLTLYSLFRWHGMHTLAREWCSRNRKLEILPWFYRSSQCGQYSLPVQTKRRRWSHPVRNEAWRWAIARFHLAVQLSVCNILAVRVQVHQ